MTACGVDTASLPTLHRTDFFTSHEALLLPYEEALTRADPMSGDLYATSAHMIWIGERTRQLEGAHVAYFASVANPIGCKVDPTATADEVLELCERLNPARIPGRLTLISRMGAAGIEDGLRPLLAAVRDAGHPVVWACDPMHGHTFTSDSGHKTRRVDDILDEIAGFFRAHEAEGTWAGGVHVELTSDDVTECLGGSHEILDSDLDARYETVCDPRLNGRQSLDLAFRVAEALRARSAA
jgi:3-deoxy-7-phosphoheptulonate synthase